MKVDLFILPEIVDCNSLRSVVLGSNTFTLSNSLRIINNEHLVTIDIGNGSFGGNAGMADSKFELESIDCMIM